jgi:cyclophilin family peptidyl-prolyl cis-trans isomerase
MVTAPLQAGTVVRVSTGLGEMDVELYDLDKPVTVQNFLGYVRSNAYQNCFFHRCVPGFALQGGGFVALDGLSPDRVAPPWTNLGAVPSHGDITNEFTLDRRFSNVFGTLAMAKRGEDPNSACSQWFFNLGDNSGNLDHQNGGFTVFGRVLRGTNLLALFNTLSSGQNLVDLQTLYPSDPVAGIFTDLPTYALGVNAPPYNQLVYFNVRAVADPVIVSLGPDGELTWNSTAGQTNVIEFSSQLPPVWQTLMATNGTGGSLRYRDLAAAGNARFYRVRMDY